ncbi:MAG: hypothetical protein QMD10_12285, partial [Desulfitobacteriaceae bacterium]|nr:hypothetical protein [Desulfitobacteriaceae bacterium]
MGTRKRNQHCLRGRHRRDIKRFLREVRRSNEYTEDDKARGGHSEARALSNPGGSAVLYGRLHPSLGQLVTRRSEALQQIVPVGANYGYDIEVLVGLERFVHHRQREEIRTILQAEHGISISSGEVSVLARRFLSHLQELHLAHTESIKEIFTQYGG